MAESKTKNILNKNTDKAKRPTLEKRTIYFNRDKDCNKNNLKKSHKWLKTTKIMKIIGVENSYNKVIDEISGEVHFVKNDDKIYYEFLEERDLNFNKVFKTMWENMLKLFGDSAKTRIIKFLIINKDRDNCVFATSAEIATKCETQERVVQKIIKEFREINFIKKIKNGVYQVNPDFLFKGSHKARINAKDKFNKPLIAVKKGI